MAKTAIIIGAGPAGLTAAYELLEHTDIIPVLLEANTVIGGLSKTILYKGNRLFRIGLSYLRSRLFPRKPEITLEDFHQSFRAGIVPDLF
jgi:protoporphyrinogen oxidase